MNSWDFEWVYGKGGEGGKVCWKRKLQSLQDLGLQPDNFFFILNIRLLTKIDYEDVSLYSDIP